MRKWWQETEGPHAHGAETKNYHLQSLSGINILRDAGERWTMLDDEKQASVLLTLPETPEQTAGTSALGRNNRDGGYLGKYENCVSLLPFLIHVWLISTHIVLLSWDSFSVDRFKSKNKTKPQ